LRSNPSSRSGTDASRGPATPADRMFLEQEAPYLDLRPIGGIWACTDQLPGYEVELLRGMDIDPRRCTYAAAARKLKPYTGPRADPRHPLGRAGIERHAGLVESVRRALGVSAHP
jgi:hypothetical protein